MRKILTLLFLAMACASVRAQTVNTLPTIDDPQDADRIDTYTRGFAAAFRLDTLKSYFQAGGTFAGRAVDTIYLNSTNDSLVVEFTDGGSYLIGDIVGEEGPQGPQGVQGPTGATGPAGSDAPNYWTQVGSDLYRNGSFVGINVNNPPHELSISGKSSTDFTNVSIRSGRSTAGQGFARLEFDANSNGSILPFFSWRLQIKNSLTRSAILQFEDWSLGANRYFATMQNGKFGLGHNFEPLTTFDLSGNMYVREGRVGVKVSQPEAPMHLRESTVGRERYLQFEAIDGGSHEAGIGNGTSISNRSILAMYSYVPSETWGMFLRGLTNVANSDIDEPVIVFQSAVTDDDDDPNGGNFSRVDRPLAVFRNGLDYELYIEEDGDLTGGHRYNISEPLTSGDDKKVATYSSADGQVQMMDNPAIGNGGEIEVPINTDLRGYSYPSSALGDTRLSFGKFYQSGFNSRFYALDRIGFGIDLKSKINSSGDLIESYLTISDRSQFGGLHYTGKDILTLQSSGFAERGFSFEGGEFDYVFGPNASDRYELGAMELPDDGPATLVTTTNGETDWNTAEMIYDLENNQTYSLFPAGGFLNASIGTVPLESGLYEFKIVLYYTTSTTALDVRFNTSGTSISGSFLSGVSGNTSNLTNTTEIGLNTATSERREIVTGYFTATANGSLNIQFKVDSGTAVLVAGSHLNIKKIR